MSKRPSSDFQESSIKKRAKKNFDDSSLFGNDTSSTQNSDTTLDIDHDEHEAIKVKITKIIEKSPADQKINDLTNIFKEIINSNNAQEKRKLNSVFTILIEYISNNSTKLEDKLVSQISSLLALQIDSLVLVVLKNSVDLFISKIESQTDYNEKCIELFVELFKYIQKLPVVDHGSGNDYVQRKILSLFSYKWNQATALNVLNLIKNINLDAEQMKLLINKLFDLNEIIWPNIQIPNLINVILSFSSNKTHRSLLFESILSFFTELRNNPLNKANTQKSDFIDAETLSILHIIHVIKKEQSASKDLMKILKFKLNRNLVQLVQPFTFGLILSLVKVLPQQDAVIDSLLKQIIVRIFESEMKWKKHIWIIKSLTEDEKKLTSYLIKPSKCRLFATESLLPGLIEFIFELLDSNGVRMNKTSKAYNLKEHITIYASEMIRDLFRNFPISRDEILNQITERIFSASFSKSVVFIDQLTILIMSEPASSFQDYFRRFKGRLDHMIYMTPVVALEFLTAIKPLLKYDSIYKDNLIITLKKSIYQTDLDVRKVGLNGLICLLTTTKLSNFLPSSQASQSMSLSQSQSQISRINMSQEKYAEKNCLEIFLSLRRCLTQQPEIRSKLYQSCCSLIVQNTTLVGPTLNLLLTNLENYLLKTDLEFILELSKCLKVNESNEVELVEPIDVMLHAIHLCDDKYDKLELQSKFQDQLDEDIKKHSDLIKAYFEKLRSYLLQSQPQYLVDTYKAQINLLMLKRNAPPAPAFETQNTTNVNNSKNDIVLTMPFYQCLLGCYEALIEHFFSMGSFKAMRDLYKKFNLMHDFAQKQLTTGSASEEKQAAPKKKPAPKKKKENKNPNDNDEDNEIKASSNDVNSFADLSTTVNAAHPLLESTTNDGNVTVAAGAKKKAAPKSALKKATPFSYTHRLSYSCTLKLVELYFTKSKKFKMENEYSDESVTEFVQQLQVDENFHKYLMKVLNQQLELIINELNHLKTNPLTTPFVYDCESYSDKELFNFLSKIWGIFWHEMNNLKCPNGECDKENELFYCNECIKFKLTYVKIISQIWKIVFIKFNPKLNDLFSFSILDDAQSSQPSCSSDSTTVAVGVLDCCRRFVDRCTSTHSKYMVNSLKLANEILSLMYDIGTSITLKITDYANLFKWTQATFTGEYISDPIVIKALTKFFIFITWNKNSSGALMKYICQDLVFLFGTPRDSGADAPATEQVFSCMTQENVSLLIGCVYEELQHIFVIFEWFITFKSDFNSMTHFYKQLSPVLESIKCLLLVELQKNFSPEPLIKLLVKFYNFMIAYCKSVLNREISSEEDAQIKLCVDFTAKKLQRPLNQFIRLIQNAKSSAAEKGKGEKGGGEKGKKQKDDNMSSTKLIKYARMIPNLVYSIEQYEQQLKLLNKHLKDRVDLTEHFEACVRDFKIVLPDETQSQLNDESQSNDTTNHETNNEEDETNQQNNSNEEESVIDDDDE